MMTDSNFLPADSILFNYSEFRVSGAAEPNAQGCANAHPIFQHQARKGQILRTQILTSIK